MPKLDKEVILWHILDNMPIGIKMTYNQIRRLVSNEISVGLISSIIWENKNRFFFEEERFGDKEWMVRKLITRKF